MPDMPSPITVTDEYLRAIHGVLGEIRDRLPAPKREPKAGQTDVSEPGKPAAKQASARPAASKQTKIKES